MENIELSAWHESGRVFFAYLSGYTCDSIELSDTDVGGGKSVLNGGEDTLFIQAIMTGKTQSLLLDQPELACAVAKKLIRIFCAGSCVRIYVQNNRLLDDQIELDIPGQDLRHLELIQQFLKRQNERHPEDYINRVMIDLFGEISKKEIMAPIETLAMQLLKGESHPFSRFNIEDALMLGGFRPQKPKVEKTFGVSVMEADLPEIAAKQDFPGNEKLLDDALKKFLLMTKQDISDEEIDISLAYLKGVFRKFK